VSLDVDELVIGKGGKLGYGKGADVCENASGIGVIVASKLFNVGEVGAVGVKVGAVAKFGDESFVIGRLSIVCKGMVVFVKVTLSLLLV